MNWITIILIILIIFILYIILFVRKADVYRNDPLYHYQDIKKNMKTGDIILFSCKKNKSIYQKVGYYVRTELIGCEYGHVGIIVKKDDKLYVLECVSDDHCADIYAKYLNDCGDGGIRLINLEILLQHYYDDYDGLYAIKFISKEIPYEKIVKELKNYKDTKFQDKKKIFMLGLIDICISHNLSKKLLSTDKNNKILCCSGFVHHFLNRCGVLKDYPSELFWPHLFVYDDVFKPLEIVKYSKPYRFKYSKPLTDIVK